MNADALDSGVFENGERAIYDMRALYQKYGYSRYKMSKFEEYDLYVRNKDFLVSGNVITFTDTDGRLMALKPDVTLSIVNDSNPAEKCVQKVYYNENVYRVSKGTQSYKEIMQVGLECIGDVDSYCIYEVLMLASESLKKISEDFVLDISHLGLVSAVIDGEGVSESGKQKIIKFLGEKNVHGISSVLAKENVKGENIIKLAKTYGGSVKVGSFLEEIKNENTRGYIEELLTVITALENNGFKDKVRIDFSLVSDMNYYNGFTFKGFINGIPGGVLSGGQYDRLMEKMGRSCGAIGFAVYLDMLERFNETEKEYDVDALILYDENSDIKALSDAVKMLSEGGKSVMAQKAVPAKIKYRQLLKVRERGVEIIENNA